MNTLFAENPLLLLFLVAAIGYLVGKIRVKGSSLGVSAVLFVGLAFGAFFPESSIPEIIFQLGLIFFVYSIGISSGPAFFESFRRNGIRDIGFVLLMLVLSAALAIALFYSFGLSAATITGVYAGSTTNTTALAAVIEMVNQRGLAGENDILQQLVVGYTYSYPMGVIGVMVVLKTMERLFKVDYAAEKEQLKNDYPIEEELTSRSITVTNPEVDGKEVRELKKQGNWKVLFGRIRKSTGVKLTNFDTEIQLGDTLVVVGSKADIDQVEALLGESTTDQHLLAQRDYDSRRIFVSNADVVGKTLSSLNLSENYSAIITRIRRGDIDMLAQSDTVLEIGDRIRFIAKREDLKSLSKLFGDSYYKSSQVNLFSFGLGIALGLLIGLIEFRLPGGVSFKLGIAGGPLVVGLILGALRRTGPIVWTLPYGANVTLRQMGLILLLAVIGVKSGGTFLQSLGGTEWLFIFAAGTILSMVAAVVSLLIGYKLFKIPFSLLLGFHANQPAILDFATEMSKNKVPLIGYSLMFPISLVAKILFAQILFIVLG